MHPQIVEFTRAYLVVITKVLVPSGAIAVSYTHLTLPTNREV